MVGTSLDRFMKKKVTNKIFFMPKRSRLVRKISGPDFECIQKPCPKDDHLNTGRFGIWMLTVLIQACPLTHLSSFQMVNQN